MSYLLRSLLIAVLLACCTAPGIAGRGDKAGTAAAAELLIPVGARSVALAGSSLSTVSGIEALYWNPAGLARGEMSSVLLVSHMSYLAGTSVDYFGAGVNLGGAGALGLDVKILSFGDIPVTTEDRPDGTGEIVSPRFYVFGGTFSRRISDRISLGITSHLVYESMADVSSMGVAFNGGVQYVGLGGIDRLSMGVVVRNIGPGMNFSGSGLLRPANLTGSTIQPSTVAIEATSSDLPSTIEIGAGYVVPLREGWDLTVTSAFQNNNFSDDEYKSGLEYDYNGTVSVRLGYSFSAAGTQSGYPYGWSGGVGVRTSIEGVDLSIGYAYRAVQYFSGDQLFDLILQF